MQKFPLPFASGAIELDSRLQEFDTIALNGNRFAIGHIALPGRIKRVGSQRQIEPATVSESVQAPQQLRRLRICRRRRNHAGEKMNSANAQFGDHILASAMPDMDRFTVCKRQILVGFLPGARDKTMFQHARLRTAKSRLGFGAHAIAGAGAWRERETAEKQQNK